MNHNQLKLAREYRGYSQLSLSKKIDGLSQSNLSKFEKGIGSISEEIRTKIIDELKFPKEFYEVNYDNYIENPNYRSKTTISKKDKISIESKVMILKRAVDDISESIDFPEFKLPVFNLEDTGYTPEYAAAYCRRYLGIKSNEPVRDVFKILESNGIVVIEIDEIENFDGFSLFSNNGIPIIILNKNMPNDRKRFTLIHELAHIILHNESNYPVSPSRNKEYEANAFVAEFLMPKNIMLSILDNLKFSDLVGLKNYWLTSMYSIIVRAKSLELIDSSRYEYFKSELSRYGYLKNEPTTVYLDSPSFLEKSVQLFYKELDYTKLEFSNYLKLPFDIMDELLPSNDYSIKLKLIRNVI